MAVRAPAILASALAFSSVALAGCGGARATAPAPADAAQAPLTVRVRLPAAFAGTSLSATVYADGLLAPATPSVTVSLASPTCALDGAERLCTLRVPGPVGLVDVALRVATAGGAALSGSAPRRVLAAGGSVVSLAFDGKAARWAVSPHLLAAPADGAPHAVSFAVSAEDAQGFVVLHDAPQPPATLSVAGDILRQLEISAQGGGTFVAQYAGQALGDVRLTAAAPGAASATATFASLGVNPTTLAIAPGQSAPLRVSLAHYGGAFEATGGAGCSVTPPAATPAVAGGAAEFSVRLSSAQACTVTLRAAELDVPIVIPAKNAIAYPGIGIGASKIAHVVVLFQENRSFDNIFGGLDDKGKPFPGADTVSNPNPGEPSPHNHLGQPVPMAIGMLEECYDPYHYHANGMTDIDNGKMDGFDHEGVIKEQCAPNPAPTNYVYRTMEYGEVEPYWKMGEQYAISDRMFEPFTSSSYGPHLFVVAGQSMHTIDNPNGGSWGCDNVTGGTVGLMDDVTGGEHGNVSPCFVAPTLADLMDQRGVSWRYYATDNHDFGYDWSAYNSFNGIRYGPDWSANVVNPPAQILTDVAGGTLAGMTWVTPTNATSDHPQSHSNLGPAWITSVVDAIGQSQFWNTTAIFITWDDWGGWYDHVPPPVTTKYFSLGIRAPLIVVSPYARAGYVSHVTHTTGSILHFAEEVLNLPSLGEEDARRDDFMDAFDFSQAPIPFTPFVQKKHSKAEVVRAASQPTRVPEDERAGD